MGIHEWAYDSIVSNDARYAVPHADKAETLHNRKKEVELGFNLPTGFKEAERCLNCDVQTVFTESKCIECDACMDICPTNVITFLFNGDPEDELRERLLVPAHNKDQAIMVSDKLPGTGRVMVKDEDVCLHCGLCAERCPTAAWDMQQFYYNTTKAGKCH
jgi:ferredoxin